MWLGLLVTFGIIYGSLLPFEYRAATMHEAIYEYSHISWLDLGVESRADWVANLVLYVPLGFFVCGSLGKRRLLVAIFLTTLIGAALSASVEFIQIWAAPRTVSLNDIVAEFVGTCLGITAWVLFGKRIVHYARLMSTNGPEAVRAAVILYVLVYCFVTLFPFDFLVSGSEIHDHLENSSLIVWVPRNLLSARGILHILLKVSLMVPLGVAVRLIWQSNWFAAGLVAATLSGVLEIAHLFEFSQQTDAASVGAAAIGAMGGNIFAHSLDRYVRSSKSWLRQLAIVATPFYLAILPVAYGWKFSHVGREQIEQTLATTRWLPFYYHYFTSEGNALASVVEIFASFAPLGLLTWAVRYQPNQPAAHIRSLAPVALTALLLSIILETGGLITAGHRPDPTNVLIAVVAAMLAKRGCEWLARVLASIPGADWAAR